MIDRFGYTIRHGLGRGVVVSRRNDIGTTPPYLASARASSAGRASNFTDGEQRKLSVFAISAKRYALFTWEADGCIRIAKYSEHGLGHLLAPNDPDDESGDWIAET